VVGCGPVGLCAVVAALEYGPARLFAIDSVPSRLELARSLGAEPLNFVDDMAGLKERLLAATDGRGADVVMEVVGLPPALRLAYDIVRPFGTISSVGVHNAEVPPPFCSSLGNLTKTQIPISGAEAYAKNIKLQFGRCPVRSVFPDALEVLKQQGHRFGFMADNILPLSDAVEGYDLFDRMMVQKVIFRAQA